MREVEGIYRNEFNVEFRIDRLQVNLLFLLLDWYVLVFSIHHSNVN